MMSQEFEKLLVEALEGKRIDLENINLILSESELNELQEAMLLAQEIDHDKNLLCQDIDKPISDRLAGYIADAVRQDNIESISNNTSGDSPTPATQDIQREGEQSGNWFDDQWNCFWGWVIRRFNLSHNSKEFWQELEKNTTRKPFPVFKFIAVMSQILVLVILAKIFLFPSGSPVPDNPLPDEKVVVHSQEASRLIDYTDKVQIALAPQGSFDKISDAKIDLNQGTVWLEVEKGGEGFEVNTGNETIRVTGTSFGVSSEGDKKVVEVFEGSVEIIGAEQSLVISQGERVEWEADIQLARFSELSPDSKPLLAAAAGVPIKLDKAPAIVQNENVPFWQKIRPRRNGEGIVNEPTALNCEVTSHPLGLAITGSKKEGQNSLVLWKLKKPLRGQVSFQLECQSSQSLDPELISQNAFFVFGQEAGESNQIKCGTHIKLGSYSIHKGNPKPIIMLDGKTMVKSQQPFKPSQKFILRIRVDTLQKKIMMQAKGDKVIVQPLPAHINEIRYIGYQVRKCKSAFSEIKILTE